jgi:hypothetical protein
LQQIPTEARLFRYRLRERRQRKPQGGGAQSPDVKCNYICRLEIDFLQYITDAGFNRKSLALGRPQAKSAVSQPMSSEELIKQHSKELRALELEECLVAKHPEELNKTTEAAIPKVKESQPAPAPAPRTAATPEDQKAAIDAAVTTALAAKEVEQKAKHDAAIEKAVEGGHLEGTMKLILKDTQLVRAQNRVKELEKQIKEWKKAGFISSEAATESTSVPAASSSALDTPGAYAASAPSPTTAAPTSCSPGGSSALMSPPLVPPLAIARGAWLGP